MNWFTRLLARMLKKRLEHTYLMEVTYKNGKKSEVQAMELDQLYSQWSMEVQKNNAVDMVIREIYQLDDGKERLEIIPYDLVAARVRLNSANQ